MFEGLSDKLVSSLKKLRGQVRITEANIEETLKEIRLALIEADVHFRVVKNLLERVKSKAIGKLVTNNATAGQEFGQIVFDELKSVLGGEAVHLNVKENPSVIFVVGLQGSGKTTSSAKLALYIRNHFKKKPGLVSVDVYRPAAQDQLVTLAKQTDLPYLPPLAGEKPETILARAKEWAQTQQIDVVLVDTAGRLQIDESLMAELANLKKFWPPHEVLLVADAMLGQQSVDVAAGFHQTVTLTGLILTKIDGDAKGGAALSIKESTGVPIKFLGVGEKISALEVFHPDRLASRLLDLGDLQSLAEKVQGTVDPEQAKASMKKLMKNQFSVEDFLSQLQMMKRMGGMESILKMLPGMGSAMKQLKSMTPPDKELKKIEAIIQSMTKGERLNHRILNGSRRARIAMGSGTEVKDVNRFIQQFEQSQKMMSGLMKGGLGGLARGGKGFPFR